MIIYQRSAGARFPYGMIGGSISIPLLPGGGVPAGRGGR